jgi:hypothetical protein
MTNVMRGNVGYYRPRSARFLKLVTTSGGVLKLNGLSAAAGGAIEEPLVDAATQTLITAGEAEAPAGHHDAGFAILHRGEEAFWLLLHWWIPGGILSLKFWRAERTTGTPHFVPGPEAYMACIWELGVIAYERDAWIETVMSGRSTDDYLQLRMPRSTV